MPVTDPDPDLRALLADRSAAAPPTAAAQRVAAVQRRVQTIRRRRRRAAAGSLLVVLLVAAVAVAPGLLRGTQHKTAPMPAHEQRVAGGLLPRFNGGGEATSYVVFDTDRTRTTSFTFTPHTWTFRIANTCDRDMPESHMISYEINGKALLSGSCGRGLSAGGPSWGQEQQTYQEQYGVHLGEPVTVTARVVAASHGHAPDKEPVFTGPMSTYRVAVAVYTPVPRARYPVPPRPEHLSSLDGTDSFPGGRLLAAVDSRRVGANGAGSVVVRLPREYARVDLNAVAPGTLRVSVNGVTINEWSSWTWSPEGYGGISLSPRELAPYGLDIHSGDRLTVRITASHFTTPGWRAEVHEGDGLH